MGWQTWRVTGQRRARLGRLAWLGYVGRDLLLDDLELLRQDGSELLDDVRAVVCALQLHDDRLDNFIIDAAEINGGGRGVVVGIPHFDRSCSEWPGRRWRGSRIGSVPLGGRRIRGVSIDVGDMGAFYLSGGRGLSVHAFGRTGGGARGEEARGEGRR